jgi:fatty acid desaturase
MNDIDDDSPLDPAAMLALLEGQQQDVQRKLARYVPAILLAWGVAWVVGFSALWAIEGAKPVFALPLPIAVGVFIALMVIAVVVSAVAGTRSQRGIRNSPAARFTGTVYGITGSAGFFAIFVFAAALDVNGMDQHLMNIYYPSATGLFIGLMYIIAGAIWHAIPSIWMGAWIGIVALVAPFFGYPTNYLVFAIAGGGVFLIGALFMLAYSRGKRAAV